MLTGHDIRMFHKRGIYRGAVHLHAGKILTGGTREEGTGVHRGKSGMGKIRENDSPQPEIQRKGG